MANYTHNISVSKRSCQSKAIFLDCLIENFKKGFSDDFGVKGKSQKLCIFCKFDWMHRCPAWSLEEKLHVGIIC